MPMVLRLAAFEHDDRGRCVEEFVCAVEWPRWLSRLPAWAKDAYCNRRARQLAQHAPRIAHVQHLPSSGRDLFVVGMNRWAHKPLGAFVWWQLRVPDYKVDWPVTHTFIQIDRATMYLHTWSQAQEPVCSDERNVVIDVTGTPWERGWQRPVFGTFALIDGALTFTPTERVAAPRSAPAQLIEALVGLDPIALRRPQTACASAQGASV